LEFSQLTPQELQFWKSFKQEDIFEWLSGSPIHPPDYCEYIQILSSFTDNVQVPQQPDQPQQQLQLQQPAIPNPVPRT